MDQEGCTLGLPDGIETTDSDVGIGESLGGVADLSQDLAGIIASEHGQLVHGPVPAHCTPKCLRMTANPRLSNHDGHTQSSSEAQISREGFNIR